jgi:hypothetical protein
MADDYSLSLRLGFMKADQPSEKAAVHLAHLRFIVKMSASESLAISSYHCLFMT